MTQAEQILRDLLNKCKIGTSILNTREKAYNPTTKAGNGKVVALCQSLQGAGFIKVKATSNWEMFRSENVTVVRIKSNDVFRKHECISIEVK